MDPYRALQVHPDADPETIRAAYRSLLRRFHPDKNPDRKEWAEQKTRELTAAFAILNDPEKRRAYDPRRAEGGKRKVREGGQDTGGFASRVVEDVPYSVLRSEYHRLEAEVARLRLDNRNLGMRIEQLTSQLNVRDEELERLQRRLAEVDAQRLQMEQALAVAEKQCELLRARLRPSEETPTRPEISAGESSRPSPSVLRPHTEEIAPRLREPRVLTLPSGDQTMAFVWIPGGSFEMGSPVGKPDERPVHTVHLDGFWMGVFPVTNRQFAAFVRAQPAWSKRLGGLRRHRDYLRDFQGDTPPRGRENCPITWATWHAAAAFCQWVELVLPTEAEWEYAARGGLHYDYATSNGSLLPRLANYAGNVGAVTPIRQYPPNPYGVYDMSGNVWEWCADEYAADFYGRLEASEPEPVNASRSRFRDDDAQEVPSESLRVIRGGSWRSVSADLRTSARAYQAAGLPTQFCGFRCVLPEEKTEG